MGKESDRSKLSSQQAGPMGCGRCHFLNQTRKEEGIFTCDDLEHPLLADFLKKLGFPLYMYYIINGEKIPVCPLLLPPGSVSNKNDAVAIEWKKRHEPLGLDNSSKK